MKFKPTGEPTKTNSSQSNHHRWQGRMALVNSLSKTDQMKTCNDFAQAFIERVSTISANYDQVRLVFDQYVNSSLKDTMRQNKRTKGKSTFYHIMDTLI